MGKSNLVEDGVELKRSNSQDSATRSDIDSASKQVSQIHLPEPILKEMSLNRVRATPRPNSVGSTRSTAEEEPSHISFEDEGGNKIAENFYVKNLHYSAYTAPRQVEQCCSIS
jgi:hypothetical protein